MPRIASKPASAPRAVVHTPLPPPVSYPLQTSVIPTVQRPTLGQSIKDGFGIGLGASVARNLVDNWFQKPAPITPQPTGVTSGTSVATEYQKKEYVQCMQTIKDHEHCKKLIEETS